MPEEKKSEVTEEVKEARKLSMEELENVNGGDRGSFLDRPDSQIRQKRINERPGY